MMLKRLYDKSRILFAVSWIIAYCVLMSAGDSVSAMIGVEKSMTLVIGVVLSAILLVFLKKNSLLTEHGICPPQASARSMLYYAPLIVMLSVNLWHGFSAKYGIAESVLYVLSMLTVGLLEEVIFRGVLFEAMRKDGQKSAVIVSSLTFGIGHIVNLINGSGAELLPNVLQVIYATSAGFMFVMIYLKSRSLIVCILAHGIFNALSVFINETEITSTMSIITALAITLITGSYAVYLALALKKDSDSEGDTPGSSQTESDKG